MMSKLILTFTFAVLVTVTIACTKKPVAAKVVVEIPAEFSGNFVLEMGVPQAPPLPKDGDHYVVTVPLTGNARTSTFLDNPQISLRNRSGGRVWGYSQRRFTTGDGISIGGKLEFFVGTQKDFEAEQNKKNKSGGFLKIEPAFAGA